MNGAESPIVQRDVPLAPLTSLEVGGPARLLGDARGVDELRALLDLARERSEPVLTLGGGNNVVISDHGFDGLVVRLTDDRVEPLDERDGRLHVRVGAGLEWDTLVEWSVGRGLAGLAAMSGIPGRVGAAPVGNIGAYGAEVADVLVSVRVLDVATGALRDVSAEDCGFTYRSSRFKRDWRGRSVVVEVEIALEPGGSPVIRHGELSRGLERDEISAPTVADVRRHILTIRHGKSMLANSDDPFRRTAGSFFLNPSLSNKEIDAVARRLEDPTSLPRFPAGGGREKIPAAWLIEAAGFPRGTRDGRVGLSPRHALSVVNLGGATAAEIIAFAGRVRAGVADRFGVWLEPEPVLIGFTRAEVAALVSE